MICIGRWSGGYAWVVVSDGTTERAASVYGVCIFVWKLLRSATSLYRPLFKLAMLNSMQHGLEFIPPKRPRELFHLHVKSVNLYQDLTFHPVAITGCYGGDELSLWCLGY